MALNSYMFRVLRRFLGSVVVVLTFFIAFMIVPVLAHSKKQNILVLHSYHKGLSWTDNLHQGIIDGLGNHPELEIYTEYLDTKRHFSTERLEISAAYLQQKYKSIPLDTLVVSDNNALAFAVERREALFPNVPLVFAGINNFTDELIQGQNNISGVVEVTDSFETVRIALQLHPDAKTIHVVHDQTATSIAESSKLKAQLSGKFTEKEFRYHTNLSTKDLLKTLSSVPASDIVLLILWNKDAVGKYFSYEESADRITQASAAPVYGLWDFYLDHGVVGGKLVSARAQGLFAAKIIRILVSGEPVSSILIERKSPNRLLFDYRELVHFQIDRESLPEGSVVLFDSVHHDPIKHDTTRSIYKIGVLAKRGEQKCLDQWQATADYLSRQIPGSIFQIEPLDFNELRKEVANANVDFVLTNSSYYVELEIEYKANRIATMINKLGDFHSVQFGGVVFTKSENNEIQTFQDLSDRSFMAVDESSFGGWLAARKVLEDIGINPTQDFKSLQFAGTHDAVVNAVLDGRADAGTVRTDTLERMVQEGKIRMGDVRIIHALNQEGFPYVLSTELYPEWPFAAMPHVPVKVASRVSAALLNMKENSEAATNAKIAGWTAPLPYESVRIMMQQLRHGPFRDYGKVTLTKLIRQHWTSVLLGVALFIMLILFSVWSVSSKRKIQRVARNLKKSREQFLLAANGSQDGMWDWDLRDNSLFLSENWKRMLGYRDDELPNVFSSFSDNVHPDDLQRVQTNLDNYLNGDIDHYSIEFRMKHKDGHDVDILARGEAIRDENGKPIHMAGSQTDITERKKAEEIILKANSNMKLAADAAGFGIWTLDLIENRLEWDEWMFRLYGVNEADFGGAYEAWQAGVHPDDVVRSSKEVELALSGEREFDSEFRIVRPNGEIRYIKAYAKVLRDDQGTPIRMTGINYDVTKRKQAEMELSEKEARLSAITTSAQDAIIMIDNSGIVSFWNPAAEIILGYSSEEILGNNFHDVVAPKRYMEAHHKAFSGFRETGQGNAVGKTLELEAKHRDGHELPVSLSLSAVKIDDKWNAIGLLRDISEKRRSEKQLLDTNRQLEKATDQAKKMAVQAQAANVAKSQFLANMSHEIRTPMNAVVGMSDILLDMELSDRQREFVTVISKSADSLLALINDILDYSKIEADKLDIEDIDFDLRMLLEDISDVIALKAHEKGLEFVCFLPPGVPTHLIGDPSRLRQIITNLANNAVKFTENGEVAVNVELVESGENDALIRFEVKDTGIGLSSKVMEMLFQPFTQADSSTTRKFGGTGLGAFHLQTVVRDDGGRNRRGKPGGRRLVLLVYGPYENTSCP